MSCRPLRGLVRVDASDPGVTLRYTPGFMLTPAPHAERFRRLNCTAG